MISHRWKAVLIFSFCPTFFAVIYTQVATANSRYIPQHAMATPSAILHFSCDPEQSQATVKNQQYALDIGAFSFFHQILSSK